MFMRSIGLFTAAVFGLALPAFGCSANVSATPEQADAEANASAPTAAVIVVQRTVGDGARGEAVARFMRMRGRQDQADALRVVGAAVDFPALGTCLSLTTLDRSVAIAPVSAVSPLEPAPSVQLLDVGAVSMEANGVQTQLFARQVPDVVDLVSGVVYARATDAEFLPARGRYVLRVAGALDADAFVVPASAPGDLGDLRVAGQDGRVVALPPAAAADLSWEPGAADDMVYVDVNATSVAQMPTIRCAFSDAGRATIAAALLPDDGTLSIHRVHRERFRARGIDSGEMRFDFAKVVSFSRR